LQSQVTVYPMQPKAAERYRDRHVPSGSKTDQVDAWCFADALRVDGQHWRPLAPEDPLTEELRLLCRDEVELITQRTALVKQLQRTLQRQLEEYRSAIEKLFAQHPDHDLFGSLPGAGAKLGPRLLSEIGTDREQYLDAQGLQCVAGTAPVSFESGKTRRAKIRWHCNRHLRHAVHLWAACSRKFCAWAGTYYKAQREKGKSHACALRCLGQ